MAQLPDRFDPAPILRTLKDFQRRTVNHAFRRLYEREYASNRFLVADEVGLGKTLVARGVIAKAIAKLQNDSSIDRIDIVYVCSNAAIAKQNINRLNVTGEQEFSVATRLTLLPLELSQLGKRKLNFVSFTPGTTFDLKYSTGMWKERWLLYHVLRSLPWLHRSGLMHMLRCDVGKQRWRNRLKETPKYDKRLIRKFISSVKRDDELFQELRSIASKFRSDPLYIPQDLRKRRNTMIGTLRRFLSHTRIRGFMRNLWKRQLFTPLKDKVEYVPKYALA